MKKVSNTEDSSLIWQQVPIISSRDINLAFELAKQEEDLLLKSVPVLLRDDLIQFCEEKKTKPSNYVPIKLYRGWVKKIRKEGLNYDIRITNY